jgi:hypothetical protein
VITSTVTAGFWHSYVKGPFVSCSAALVPTAGVRHTRGQFLTTVGSSHTLKDQFDIKHLKKITSPKIYVFHIHLAGCITDHFQVRHTVVFSIINNKYKFIFHHIFIM